MEYGAEVWATGGWREGEEAMGRFWKRLIGMRRNTNKEVVQGELGRIRMKGRWDMARLRLWNKLVSGSNPLTSWVDRQRRKDWCWYTWKILQELGKEVDSLEGQLRHEKYLDCTEGDKRKALIELRSGANDLEVDKGRREKKELKDRIC